MRTHYLVMEYVEGQDLSHVLIERGPLPVQEAADSILQAARGLEYAHSEGVVHRDIKPGNLLLDKKGTVKILDMGLARIDQPAKPIQTAGAERLTESWQVMGTSDYMAPEQAEDTHAADHRADIYSLGCTLYRLLTGQKPYKGETPLQILLAHREAAVPSLCDARDDVPAELDAVCQKMMAKPPEDRQQSMSEVIADLEGCVMPATGAWQPAPEPPPVQEAEESSTQRKLKCDSGGGEGASFKVNWHASSLRGSHASAVIRPLMPQSVEHPSRRWNVSFKTFCVCSSTRNRSYGQTIVAHRRPVTISCFAS